VEGEELGDATKPPVWTSPSTAWIDKPWGAAYNPYTVQVANARGCYG
jgi:hypothetical protein